MGVSGMSAVGNCRALLPLFVISPADPGVPSCVTHTWDTLIRDLIFWRMCTTCSLTECSMPGIDRCLHLGMEEIPRVVFPALTPYERLLAAAGGTLCRRLTSQRCPHCDLGMCSDHLPFHLEWCEA